MTIFLAVLAVTGTLLAALLAFLAPAWNQEWIDRRREARDLRASRRLVANELNLLVATLDALGQGNVGSALDMTVLLPISAWETHRLIIAGADETQVTDWRRLDTVYTRIELFRRMDAQTLTPADFSIFRDTQVKAEYVRNMLLEEEFKAAGLDPSTAELEWPTP